MDMNKCLLKKEEKLHTSGCYQNTLLQRDAKYQWHLNTHEEYLDLYIYKNIYKDYNEKLWKLDLCIRKLDTENEPQKHYQLSPVCSTRGKTSLGEGSKKSFRLWNLKREINHSYHRYLFSAYY